MRFPSIICVRDNRELIRVTILDHQVIVNQNALPWFETDFPRRSPFYLTSATSLQLNRLNLNRQLNFD